MLRSPVRTRSTASRGGVAAAVGVLALALAVPASSGAARRPSCASAKGTTIAASATVRVYRVGPSDEQTFYSCWLRTAKRTLLGRSLQLGENSQSLDTLSLAGRYVGYRQAISFGGEGLTVDVLLTDVRTGRTARVAVDTEATEAETSVGVDAVLPTPDGLLLWTGRPADCQGLHVLSAAGASTLSCGAVTEVAVVGRRVYWQQDGQTRAAVVPGPTA